MSFADPEADGRQTLRLHELTGRDAADDAAEGRQVLEGRTARAVGDGDVRIWAGRVADSFYIDLSLLAIVNGAVADGTAVDLSVASVGARNSFEGTTVETIVLEVAHRHPVLHPGTRVGVWCRTVLATDAGGWRQINRAGHPMMWPIFWPDDTHFTNPANSRHPSEDVDAVSKDIAEQVAIMVAATGTSGPARLRPSGGRLAVPGRPALRRRITGELRLRRLQWSSSGGQRTRGHALPRLRMAVPSGQAGRLRASPREPSRTSCRPDRSR